MTKLLLFTLSRPHDNLCHLESGRVEIIIVDYVSNFYGSILLKADQYETSKDTLMNSKTCPGSDIVFDSLFQSYISSGIIDRLFLPVLPGC